MRKTITSLLFALSLNVHTQINSSALQACYPLDGNAFNYATTGPLLNGSLNNVTSAVGHTGLSNTAYRLNGSASSYIELPDHPGLKSNSMSFSGWFYLEFLPVQQYLVYTKNSCSINFEAYSLITYYDPGTNKHVFRISKSNNACVYAPQIDSHTALVTDKWYHVCFYVDNSVLKLYVNGLFEGSNAHNIQFDYQAGKSVFLGGTHEADYDFPFNGRIDNVQFYNKELSPGEVGSLYKQDPKCSEITVSIPENNNSGAPVSAYPNPSRGKVYLTNLGANSLVVYNALSQQIRCTKKPVDENTTEITLEENMPGIYVIKVVDPQGNYLHTFKVIKY